MGMTMMYTFIVYFFLYYAVLLVSIDLYNKTQFIEIHCIALCFYVAI